MKRKVDTPPEAWVGVKQVAAHLGMTPTWVRQRAVIMPHVRPGREYRFRITEVDRWFQEYRGGEDYDF